VRFLTYSSGLEVLNQAIKLRGIMRKIEMRRDVQRMFGIIQRLPVASMKMPPNDEGAVTKRLPNADRA